MKLDSYRRRCGRLVINSAHFLSVSSMGLGWPVQAKESRTACLGMRALSLFVAGGQQLDVLGLEQVDCDPCFLKTRTVASFGMG